MKILVATDGHLDPETTTALIARLADDQTAVTVLTVIDHPGEMLRSFADIGVRGIDEILAETGPSTMGFGSGSATAERIQQQTRAKQGRAEPLDKYFTDTATRHQKSLLEHLGAGGITAEGVWRSSERRTAKTILQMVDLQGAELLIIGSHGAGRFEGLLGSTVTKLVRQSKVPVLLVR